MSRPELATRFGPAPTELVINDLTIGDGKEATPGARIEVHYMGVSYETGEEPDSSWNCGQSIEFPLNGLITSWQKGIPGMKVDGRRRLVCLPGRACGPAGAGHFLSGRTLVFVIDLLDVK